MSSRYEGRAEFAIVYIDNGHAEPPELCERACGDGPPDRAAVAMGGALEYGLDFPCLVDGPDGAARLEYGAYPSRIVVLDAGGRVGFDSGSSFRSGRLNTDGVEAWLEAHAAPLP